MWLKYCQFYFKHALYAGLIAFLASLVIYLWAIPIAIHSCILLILLVYTFSLLCYYTWQAYRLKQAIIEANFNHLPKSALWQELYFFLEKQQKNTAIAKQKIETEYQNFVQAIQVSPNGVMITDYAGVILWMSHRCEKLLGITEQDIGQRIQHLFRYPDFYHYWQNFQQDNCFAPTIQHENLYLKPSIVTVDQTRRLLLFQNVSERIYVERMHKEFIADVSHELNTPLTVLGNYLETLSDENLLNLEQKQHYLQKSSSTLTQMQELLEGLLLLSRLDQPSIKQKIKQQYCNMADLLNACLNDCLNNQPYQQSEDKFCINQKLLLNIECLIDDKSFKICQSNLLTPKQNDYQINGIDYLLKIAISNLLKNAFKYTPNQNTQTISCKLNKHLNSIKLNICNTGSYLKPEEINLLTKRFYRASNSANITGSGLGLSIVEKILTLHQATLSIHSDQYLQTTSFSIEFKCLN